MFQVGVLGATGYIGTPYRREIRMSPEQARLVALCGRRMHLLEDAAKVDGATLVTDDWRQVIEHADVNLVLVATPDALHHAEVLAAAAAGKHVFCEKPVGLNAEQAREMWEACIAAKVAHFVPFWTRYVPLIRRAREIYRAGQLGEIRAVVSRWHNPRPPQMPLTWRDDAELSSAGSIADVGSHAYDTMRWILGQNATRVLAHADVISPPKADLGPINLDEALAWSGDDPASLPKRKGTAFDYADIAFQWENGAVGSLLLSHAPFYRKGLAPDLELHGEHASLAVDRVRSQLLLTGPSGDVEPPQTVSSEVPANRFQEFVFPALREQISATQDNAGDREHPDLEDGWHVQRFTDAAARSAREGAWVNV